MIETIKQYLPSKLPGFEAQKIMMPSWRKKIAVPKDAHYSAVAVIIFIQNKRLKFILTKRAENLHNHSGQIALPGGQYDEKDKTLIQTAIRETYEEIAIKLETENFITELSPLYIDVSNFVVQPYVFMINFPDEIRTDKREVEKIFIVDFDKFFCSQNIVYEKIIIDGKQEIKPYYKLEKEKVWGATAMILSEFYFVFKRFTFKL